jgi:hypothetical protein
VILLRFERRIIGSLAREANRASLAGIELADYEIPSPIAAFSPDFVSFFRQVLIVFGFRKRIAATVGCT